MQHRRPPLRLRLAKAILGSHAKEYIPSLSSIFDGWGTDATGRLKHYRTKSEQLDANVGWCFTANNAIAEPTAAVEIKLYRRKKDGDREEIKEHEILELIAEPNLVHTGEQLRQLHFTYMNFVGESYIHMRRGDSPFIPAKGQLPYALDIFPSHLVSLKLGDSYTKSIVKYGRDEYPLMSFIRDVNPDPNNPYYGRSVIRAAAATLDTEDQMKEWNRRFFANNARPSLIFSTKEAFASDEPFERWKSQFHDENTGTENAFKPLLIEGGDAKPYMLSQQDLDFLNSRKFSRDEILAMWRVSPGVIGFVENVNRANLDAGFYIHALINIRPRIRQFVRQLNATLVKPYDESLELDFVDPVPEDVEAKLKASKEGVNKWWTIDEVRDMYGEEPLPDGLGEQLYIPASSAPLKDVADGSARPAAPTNDPNAENDPDDAEDGDVPTPTKALAGVKKKT